MQWLRVLLAWHVLPAVAAECRLPFRLVQVNKWKDLVHCLQAVDTCSDIHKRFCTPQKLANCEQARFNSSTFHLPDMPPLMVRQACPKSCGACEGQRTPTAAAAAVAAACEPGWSYADGSCLKHFVRPDLVPVTFDDAAVACRGEGAHLAEVDTPAKNHLLFELIRQRPKWTRKRWLASSSWIGLRTKTRSCSAAPADWSWVASGRDLSYANWLTRDPSRGVTWSTPACAEEDYRCALANFPEENLQWHDAGCGARYSASWVCSKPSLVRPAFNASCGDLGLAPINDLDACEAAAAAMGLDVRRAMVSTSVPRPEGCHYTRFRSLHLTVHPDNRGRGSTLVAVRPMGERSPIPASQTWSIQICQQANSSTPSSPPSSSKPVPFDAPLDAPLDKKTKASELRTHPEEDLATMLAASAIALLLLQRRRRLIVSAAISGIRAARSRLQALRRKQESDGLAPLVQLGLARRRRLIAVFAAGALLAHRLLRILIGRAALGPMCEDKSPAARAGIVAAELLEMSVGALLLGVDGRLCWRPLLPAWAVLVPALRLTQTALVGSELLLSGARLFEEVLWRVILGVALRPSLAFALNAAYSGGSILVYWLQVPDGMLPVSWGHCTRLYTVDATQARQRWMDWPTTSVSAFAVQELLTAAFVVVCVALLSHVMATELRNSLKLHGTQSLLSAVSDVLSKLCDAVVHLDASLRFAAPSPRFAALMHCASSPAVLSGLSFLGRLASPRDEEELRRALQEGSGSEGWTLSVNFKDAFDATVPCQIFRTSFVGPDGQPHHVLGINEVGERSALPCGLEARIGEVVNQQRYDAPPEVAPPEAVAELSQRENDDASTDSSSTGTGVDVAAGVERHFDLNPYDLMITATNTGALHLFARNPFKTRLLTYVKHAEDRDVLISWQRRVKDTLERGELPEAADRSLGPLVLSLRPDRVENTPLPAERCYSVRFEVVFPELPDEGFNEDSYAVRASITSAVRVRPSLAPSFDEGGPAQEYPARRHRHGQHRSGRAHRARSGTQPSHERVSILGPRASVRMREGAREAVLESL